MQIISDIKNWWRFWSVQISFIGILWATFSDQVVAWWNIHAVEYFPFLSPFGVKWIGLILLVTGVLARFMKQEKLNANDK